MSFCFFFFLSKRHISKTNTTCQWWTIVNNNAICSLALMHDFQIETFRVKYCTIEITNVRTSWLICSSARKLKSNLFHIDKARRKFSFQTNDAFSFLSRTIFSFQKYIDVELTLSCTFVKLEKLLSWWDDRTKTFSQRMFWFFLRMFWHFLNHLRRMTLLTWNSRSFARSLTSYERKLDVKSSDLES